MDNLRGHVALVTGAGHGLREAIAMHLSGAGASVALMARTSRNILEEACVIESRGGRALAIAADFTNPSDLSSACDEVAHQLGEVDILINNESAIGPLDSFASININDWIYASTVNLQVPVRLTRLLLPKMLESQWGRIVNISTGALNHPLRGDSYNAFIASKAGLEMHTLNLAAQLEGSGVNVNVLRSGSMQLLLEGEDPKRVGEAFYQRFLQRRSKGQITSPEAPAVSLLDLVCGDLNGQIVSAEICA